MRIVFFLFCFVPGVISAQQGYDWQAFSYGTPALTLSVPGQVEQQNTNLPPDAKAFVSEYDAYYYKNSGTGVVVTMMHAFYKDDVISDKMGAVEGTNNQWEATGSRVVILSTTENAIDGRSAVQQRGLLMNGGREYDYMDVVAVEGSRIWQVIVMIPSDDEAQEPVLQKIIDSISFD